MPEFEAKPPTYNFWLSKNFTNSLWLAGSLTNNIVD